MDLILIAVVAGVASLLTFFSGFGLGTILTPIFILFFPIEIAITLTAVVHLLNNIFKISLTYKFINWPIALKFSITAIIFSIVGSLALTQLSGDLIIFQYNLGQETISVTLIKLAMAILMFVFVLIDILPILKNISFEKDKIYVGGIVSGFFGGLAGFQGALRSMFLIKANLSKESFIGTGIFIACMIDISRLSIYFVRIDKINIEGNTNVLLVATFSAFLGAYLGSKLLKKVTLESVQMIVSIAIFVLAILLGAGIL